MQENTDQCSSTMFTANSSTAQIHYHTKYFYFQPVVCITWILDYASEKKEHFLAPVGLHSKQASKICNNEISCHEYTFVQTAPHKMSTNIAVY